VPCKKDLNTIASIWSENILGYLSPKGGAGKKPTFVNPNSIWIIIKHFIMSPWLR